MVETQTGHPPVGIDRDAGPLVDGDATEPVGVSGPTGPAGCVVKRDQRRPVVRTDGAGEDTHRRKPRPERGIRRRAQPVVLAERQALEVDQVDKLRWERPGQVVVVEIQQLEVGQGAQLRWEPPGQVVVVELQVLEVGQGAQRRRDRPRQVVLAERQALEVCHGAQFREERPGQVVVVETQTGHPPVGIDRDAGPLVDGDATEPVGVSGPTGPAGCVVKRDQRRPVLRRSLRVSVIQYYEQAGGRQQSNQSRGRTPEYHCPHGAVPFRADAFILQHDNPPYRAVSLRR